MFKMLGTAVAAITLAWAGAASAAIFWSGVVGQNDRVGDFLPLLQTPGTYTFVSDAPIEETFLFFLPNMKYHLHSGGVIQAGSNWNQYTWDQVGKPAPVATLTSTGFTFYLDPIQDRRLWTGLEVCNEWYGCGYDEVWEYRTDLFMELQFAPGNQGKALAIYFEPGGPQAAIPEPSTWAMMIIGFGAAGSMIRTARRRNAFSAA